MNHKKKLPVWAVILSVCLFLTGIFTLLTGLRVYKRTFKVKPHKIKRWRLHEKRMAELEAYEYQRFMIESTRNGYSVEALHIRSELETSNVMILVHGIRSNYYDLLPLAFRYLKDGYHVILYNQRQSGLTGGKTSTFGLYEKFDLEEVATVARRIYKEGKVGIHGFSMGAATAIMQSELNEKTDLVDFYILDAPFHTMGSTVELAVRREKSTKMPPWYVKFSGDTFLRLRKRVSYKRIAPIDVIHHSTRPILLIHGEKDDVTCPDGSRQLFGAIHHNKRRLELLPEEAHCTAHSRIEEEYFERVYQFINDFV